MHTYSMDFNFKEWANHELPNTEIANLYFHSDLKVQEIAARFGKSIGEVYRILHHFGRPNRQIKNHEAVMSLFDAGMPVHRIAEFTGYSTRNVRYIISSKKQDF